MNTLSRPELLSPAGNFEKLKYAVHYGADAVYLAGRAFGMRTAAGNFSDEELPLAVAYAHNRGKKVYLTLNTMPRSSEILGLEAYLDVIAQSGVDALIVADLGVFSLCKKRVPQIPIHVSTQGAIVNHLSCNMWYDLGASRVVLARELSLEDISTIRAKTPPKLELEAFIHGAMCVSFSGRCLLSEFYTGRDANRGSCTQPCRWIYHFSEEKRTDQVLDAEIHSGEGTYIFGSKDMCLIRHLPELCKAGISSFKIEGRMKSSYYTAAVTNAYRMTLDAMLENGGNIQPTPEILRELSGVSHREYCTGYYFSHPLLDAQLATEPGYRKEKAYLALVVGRDENTGWIRCVQKNKMTSDTAVEVLSPGKTGRALTVDRLLDENGNVITSTPHPQMTFYIQTPDELKEGDILREAIEANDTEQIF